MKFKMPSAVTRKVARQILITKKHSPSILFVGGVVGIVATTVTACRATLKLEELVDETQENLELARTMKHSDYSEKDRQKDKTLIYVQATAKLIKLYGPSIILGGLSIAALTKSHSILTKRNAGLTAAYAILEKGFSDYRKRVVDEYGGDKDRELRFGSETSTVVVQDKNGSKKKKIKTVGDGGGSIYSKLFDEYNQNWSPQPEYNMLFLRGQQCYATDRLRAKGHLFLNEVYDLLGLERTPAGSQVGWLYNKGDGDGFVDFGVFNGEDMVHFHDFVTGREGSIWLDFNVDGVIWQKI